jgi:hypothetical protein
LCGADDWEAVEMWGDAKPEWLGQYIALKNGIASHDTIGRVFAALDSTKFQDCCTHWVSTICGSLVGQEGHPHGQCFRERSGHHIGAN